MPSENGAARLDRIERALEMLIDFHVQFREEHRQLLTAQVVLTDRVDKLAVRLDTTITAINELTAAQRHTDERLNALITVVDGIIRNRPPQ